MEETEKTPVEKEENKPPKQNKLLRFLTDVLHGAAIGIAFIIPGFSGGSVAAILGIYEKIVESVADIFKHFKKSMAVLLPILLGMILGVAALIYPIQLGLKYYPIPTVSLFVGLAIGGIPSITDKMKGGRPSLPQWLSLVIALLFAGSLSVLSYYSADDVNLFHLNAGGYLLLILIGMVGSCALVVPGISGSMLLLIFGYYNPVVRLITENLLHGVEVGTCLLVLALLAVGLIVGFFLISVLMKFLLKKFPRATYFSIFGFIVGSIPAVYVSTVRQTDAALFPLYSSPWYWVVAVLLLAVGFIISFALVRYAKKKKPQTEGSN